MVGRKRIALGVVLLTLGAVVLGAGLLGIAAGAYGRERVDEERSSNPLTLVADEDDRAAELSEAAAGAGAGGVLIGIVVATLGVGILRSGIRARRDL